MRGVRRLIATGLLVLAGACGSSPPASYFILSADAPRAPATRSLALGVVELSVPEYLQRQELAVLEGGNRLVLRRNERWGEPFEEGVRRTLVLNLRALLGIDDVRPVPWPRDWTPDWKLRVAIERLDVRADGVVLQATWSLQRSLPGAAAAARAADITRPRSGDSADAIVADIAAVLAELAGEIAAALPADQSDQNPTEP